MRFLFVATFGLLPFWAAIAFVIFAYATMSGDRAGMTLWAFVVAIPACAITLAIAGVTLAVGANAAGDAQRKRKVSFAFFLLALLALALVAQYFWMKRQDNEQQLRREKERVTEFVATHPNILAETGEPMHASIASYALPSSDSMPVQYDVSASGKVRTVYAIVTADRMFSPSKLVLVCTTHLSMGQRESSKGACAQ
jgi:hypothetical protein